jgi:hypothetical protein
MVVIDEDNLTDLTANFDDWIIGLKESFGNIMHKSINDIFNMQGPPTQNSSDLEARSTNPQWPPLSPITIQLKGSSSIMMDTRKLINYCKWQIEDSYYDNMKGVVKFGWFEDSGGYGKGNNVVPTPYIAAIHEFGLTGTKVQTDFGHVMGGEPIGRTPEARRNVRWWFRNNLGMNVTGRIIIPERSMLRKTADMIVPQMEDIGDASFLMFVKKIKNVALGLN